MKSLAEGIGLNILFYVIAPAILVSISCLLGMVLDMVKGLF
jgi:hypothetical protein